MLDVEQRLVESQLALQVGERVAHWELVGRHDRETDISLVNPCICIYIRFSMVCGGRSLGGANDRVHGHPATEGRRYL